MNHWQNEREPTKKRKMVAEEVKSDEYFARSMKQTCMLVAIIVCSRRCWKWKGYDSAIEHSKFEIWEVLINFQMNIEAGSVGLSFRLCSHRSASL